MPDISTKIKLTKKTLAGAEQSHILDTTCVGFSLIASTAVPVFAVTTGGTTVPVGTVWETVVEPFQLDINGLTIYFNGLSGDVFILERLAGR